MAWSYRDEDGALAAPDQGHLDGRNPRRRQRQTCAWGGVFVEHIRESKGDGHVHVPVRRIRFWIPLVGNTSKTDSKRVKVSSRTNAPVGVTAGWMRHIRGCWRWVTNLHGESWRRQSCKASCERGVVVMPRAPGGSPSFPPRGLPARCTRHNHPSTISDSARAIDVQLRHRDALH